MEKTEQNNDLPENLGFNQEVEEFLNKNFLFRYNIVTGKTECKRLKSDVYQELDDYKMNSLLRLLAIKSIRCSNTKLSGLMCSSFVPQYNPIKEYLDNLPSYDDGHDYIADLAQTVETTNQTLWHKYLKKWTVAWAASLYDESIINHTVIVLNGGQGDGKSRWIAKIVPQVLNKYVYAGTINPDNKDTLIYLSECILINLDEFENLNRNQLGGIKELITKEKVKIRRPYGHNSENLPRRASFIASVNQNEFLTDVTGNRRFLCFEAKNIDHEHSVNMDLVFSQALFHFRSGYQYYLDKADIEELNQSNERFRYLSIEEEALLNNFETCEADDNATYMTNSEILSVIAEEMKIRTDQASKKRLGMALAKYNYWRGKKGGRWVYAVKEKKSFPATCLYKDLTKSEDAA